MNKRVADLTIVQVVVVLFILGVLVFAVVAATRAHSADQAYHQQFENAKNCLIRVGTSNPCK